MFLFIIFFMIRYIFSMIFSPLMPPGFQMIHFLFFSDSFQLRCWRLLIFIRFSLIIFTYIAGHILSWFRFDAEPAIDIIFRHLLSPRHWADISFDTPLLATSWLRFDFSYFSFHFFFVFIRYSFSFRCHYMLSAFISLHYAISSRDYWLHFFIW